MKQQLQIQQTQKQQFILTQESSKSLEILKMDNRELIRLLLKEVQNNPMIDYQISSSREFSVLETLSAPVSLQDDLYYQLHTTRQPYDERVCSFLIDSLDEHGFLSYSDDEYCKLLSITKEQLASACLLIQSFEPMGVGTHNSRECLILQCKKKNHPHASAILTQYSEELIQRNNKAILHGLSLSANEFHQELAFLQTCTPYPYQGEPNESYILPEVEIKITDNEIQIVPVIYGTHSIKEEYLKLLSSHEQLRAYFKDASILFESIHRRNVSLMMIINELVTIQKNFFLYHDELHPCTLHDLSQLLELNTSTISRALHNKYYLFEGEIYPLRKLFCTANANGDSSDGIRKALRKLIRNEDKKNPLSDQQIVIKLSAMGFSTSRRTIAKYRNQLQIPGSCERKTLN